MGFLIRHHLTDQFVDIFNPVGRIFLLGLLQLLHVARGLQNITHKLLQTVEFQLAAKRLDHGHKRLEFGSAPADGHDLIRLF